LSGWREASGPDSFAGLTFPKDPSFATLQSLPQFELLISPLQAKYPDHFGLLYETTPLQNRQGSLFVPDLLSATLS
jgi:hypothetical protein